MAKLHGRGSSAVTPGLVTDAVTLTPTLRELSLVMDDFPLRDVFPVRAALRLNGTLTALTLQLGQVQLSMADCLPVADRCRMRELLQLPQTSSSAAATASSESDRTLFVPSSELSARSAWRELGRGHFGAVFAATRMRSLPSADGPQPVCIKVFHADEVDVAVSDVHAQRRLFVRLQINEFALVQELGPAAVTQLASSCVFATGFAIDADGGMLVLLPLLSGSLESRLKRRPPPLVKLSWVVDVARALAALHAAGLVHRDLAARNVLLDDDAPQASEEAGVDSEAPTLAGTAKVCDFGLSCAIASPWVPESVPSGIWPPEVLGLGPPFAGGPADGC